MSLKQYNWTDGEVITAEKLNRGGVTIVGETVEIGAGTVHVTLDMTLQEIYDAMGKGIVVTVQEDQETSGKSLMICVQCSLVSSGGPGLAFFYSIKNNESYMFVCATNDGFPQYRAK